MKELLAVIGANYGDEGKGHVVDYLSTNESITVRFNGGAQAGHTVVLPDGRRHVFHHFGSGTLQGAGTFLAKEFLVNPIIFVEEAKQLGGRLDVYAHPRCRATTVFDMMINQAVELSRGKNRHGSCGLGIHETVVRSKNPNYAIFASDLWGDKAWLRERLNAIRTFYAKGRCEELGIAVPPLMMNDNLLDHYMEDVDYFAKNCGWAGIEILTGYDRIVFEGAQGLLLDERAPGFPHVTCSSTGLRNVVSTLAEANIWDPLDVYYVTRPYITRHGAGPILHERTKEEIGDIEDKTNLPNDWQGTLRFGLLDIDQTANAILNDHTDRATSARLAITCLDHIRPNGIQWVEDGKTKLGDPSNLFFALADKTRAGQKDVLFFFGPTKNDVVK